MNTILLIEDNADVRENIAEILTLAGYQVTSCKNGKEGIQQLSSVSPDLILCDVMMPDLDGYGVLKIINTHAQWSKIPFIFLTAKAELTDMRKGMSMGAADYITKPFDDKDLLDSIELRLSKYAPHTENRHLEKVHEVDHKYLLHSLMASIDKFELRTYAKKNTIIAEGQMSRYVYLVKKGLVKNILTNELGKDFITTILSDNTIFGHEGILLQKPCHYTAITLEESSIYLIPKDFFTDLIQKDMHAMASLLKQSLSTTFHYENQLIEQAYGSVRHKVAHALLLFYQYNDGKKTFLAQREDLASVAGTAKETLIRTLSELKNEGLIEIQDHFISILNLKGLTSIPV
jgi:CRP/FNR family transcriptional regulator, polysaccharide utilization system transcription regulator